MTKYQKKQYKKLIAVREKILALPSSPEKNILLHSMGLRLDALAVEMNDELLDLYLDFTIKDYEYILSPEYLLSS